MNATVGSVSGLFPGNEFQIEGPFVRDTSVKALFGQDTQLDFGHVEPRTMSRGVMKAEPGGNPIRFHFAKGFDQGVVGMGVEIIQNDIKANGIRVKDIDQITHGVSEILFGAATSNEEMASPSFRFSENRLRVLLRLYSWSSRRG